MKRDGVGSESFAPLSRHTRRWRPLVARRAATTALTLVVVIVLTGSMVLLVGDAGQVARALERFAWWLLLPALLLTLWNYALRFAKWQFYLREMAITGLPWSLSLLIFLSAFAMSVTPGKVGELLKCALLQRVAAVPVSRAAGILVAERLTDGLAMIVLASVGALQFAAGRWVLAAAALTAAMALATFYDGRFLVWVAGRLPHDEVRAKVHRLLEGFTASAQQLLRPRPLFIGTGIGVCAWLGECAAFSLILVGLGLTPNLELFVIATFVLAVSTLAGALSMLPGGLGVAEASVAAMLLLLVKDGAMDQGVALMATLLIRFATLWFGVGVGAVALGILRIRLGRNGVAESMV